MNSYYNNSALEGEELTSHSHGDPLTTPDSPVSAHEINNRLLSVAHDYRRAFGQRECKALYDAGRDPRREGSFVTSKLGRGYKSYKHAHCDDGAIGEGYSDSIARLLSRQWSSVDQLNRLASQDRGFERFVLRHVDELLSSAQVEKIRANAGAHCPIRAEELCKLIAGTFSISAPGTFGNPGRSALEAPGYFDIDAAVSRYFNITERQRVELRFEFLNLTNRVNSALRMVSYRMRPSARFLATSALAFYSLR